MKTEWPYILGLYCLSIVTAFWIVSGAYASAAVTALFCVHNSLMMAAQRVRCERN